jgi:SAM-dependent methyltransferase
MGEPAGSCLVCGGVRRALPVPGPRSMLSDGRVVDRPLEKADCSVCGAVGHRHPPSAAEVAATFEGGYSLYAHAPGRPEEDARQRAYAEWIAGSLPGAAPTRLFEIGCGNGSLLRALASRFPGAEAGGVDPSADAVAHAQAAGIAACRGFASDAAAAVRDRDLVVSVNVVEHTADPVAFLRALAAIGSEDARLVVICPDAVTPSSELLVFDHLHTLTDGALARLAAEAGLHVRSSHPAPTALGAFRMHLLGRGGAAPSPGPMATDALHAARAAYLDSWARLDGVLLERARGDGLACFGTGEAALLLRAYAPRAWAKVHRFTVDHPNAGTFCGLPVVPVASIEAGRGETMLLAVRPRDQEKVAGRLAGRWARMVRWDDVVTA